MSSILNASASSLLAGSGANNWLADAETSIQNQANRGGVLGMLANAASGSNDGSINSFLSNSASTANAFASITLNNTSGASQLAAQIAAQNQQQLAAQKVQQMQDAMTQAQQMVQPANTLDPVIYFNDGTTIDTTSNIMTRPDGTQIDTTTGALYVDPSSLVQMANGAYLNTSTNVLTEPDGTQIDTVTGLKVTKSA